MLTRLDPVSYGVDASRQVVLLQRGNAPVVVNQLSLTLFGRPLSVAGDLAVVTSFAVLMTVLVVHGFSQQE